MATAIEEPGMEARGVSDRIDDADSRRFADDAGVVWTAELRRPRSAPLPGRGGSPMILFWSDTRACLATLRSARGLSELSEDDLRRHLRACLSG